MIEIESTGVPIKAWIEGVPLEDEATVREVDRSNIRKLFLTLRW